MDILSQFLRGKLHFLHDEEEIRRLSLVYSRILPQPQRIFLEDDSATPMLGFPVLDSPGMQAIREALQAYLELEETVQFSLLRRSPWDRKGYEAAWGRYRSALLRALDNVTASSYGRGYPAIFWLHHSLAVAELLRDTPKRVLRQDLELGRRRGDEIKYRVFHKYVDNVLPLAYDVVHRHAAQTEELEEQVFPRLLTRMRDNVLILTEVQVTAQLGELMSYFQGYLRLDGRDLLQRLEALREWHRRMFAKAPRLRAAAAQLLGVDSDADPDLLLHRSGYVEFLTHEDGYDERRLLTPQQVKVWESLLVKLKEYEIFHNARRHVFSVAQEDGKPFVRERSHGKRVAVSATTRPLDFMSPWVVDPLVARFGMIYDLTDFSELVSLLRRAGSEEQNRSFRMLFRFQRRVGTLALARRLRMEKYLGDGAFFSGREATLTLATAVHVQRHYRQMLGDGFFFDRGLRMALNYGQYRLLPIQTGHPGESFRYEFFGHGIVELSRLVTGKATREVEEVKFLLVNQGYPEATVNRFFAPLSQRNVELFDKEEESRRFFAYINRNGHLVNEGIVATEAFVVQLAAEHRFEQLHAAADGRRRFVVVPFDDQGEEVLVGLRWLGRAHLKGLDEVPIYEVVDPAIWPAAELETLEEDDLLRALGSVAAQPPAAGGQPAATR